MKPEEFVEQAQDQLVLVARPLSLDDLRSSGEQSNRPTHVYAFVPRPLPPEIAYDGAIVAAIGRAMLALGRLDELVRDLPKPAVLVRPFIRREAVASSRIEGTVADVADLVMYEATNEVRETSPDVKEVQNYVNALDHGLNQPADRRLSLTLICELHRLLLQDVRGSHLQPGELRSRLVFIGQPTDRIEHARFVPPPPWEVEPLLRDLERYIDTEDATTPLIRLALIHYQFEAIHPFSDGNGRLGRLMIALLLRKWGVMRHPIIDLSAYAVRHRDAYIDGLLRVSRDADWRNWIDFFLSAVEEQAQDALDRSKRLLALRDRYLSIVGSEFRSDSTDLLIDHLFERTRITAREASDILAVTFPTAQNYIKRLIELGILVERAERRRNRVYLAGEIVRILDENLSASGA